LLRSLEDALPWFVPVPGGLRRSPREVVETERRRLEEERRAREREAALVDWLAAGASGEPPDGAAPILDELRRLAIRGAEGASKRAVRIARRIACPEPDDLLERLETVGLVPPHLDPGPLRLGVPVEFPDDLASGDLPDAFDGDRLDLTRLPTIALDDPDTVEVDDALSWEEIDGGVLLHVHIADVAARIPRGTPLDVEAARRARTVYEPDRRIPMLPPEAVAACSLEEGEVRPALTGTFRVTREGAILSREFRETLVRVDRRCGYDEAGPETLGPMADVARALRVRRVAEGAVCLDLPDAKIAVEDGIPRLKIRRPGNPADVVVAEAAVLYNRVVADRLAEAGAAAVFRRQAAHEESLPGPDDPLRILRARRMLPPAEASLEPARHHGVAADRYLTATSPIRRYVDLIHQRQLAAILAGLPPPHDRESLAAALDDLRERERTARTIEAERHAYWMGRLLEAHVGEVLDVLVSRKMPAGRIGVWSPDLLRELTLRLPKSHPRVAEGDPFRVRVVRVRPRRGSIHLEPDREAP
jgi:exoribonuclease-2